MKQLIITLSILFLFSCNRTTTEEVFFNEEVSTLTFEKDTDLVEFLDHKFSRLGRINQRLKKSSIKYQVNGDQFIKYERPAGKSTNVFKIDRIGNFYYLNFHKVKCDPKKTERKIVDVYQIRISVKEDDLEDHIENGFNCLINTFI